MLKKHWFHENGSSVRAWCIYEIEWLRKRKLYFKKDNKESDSTLNKFIFDNHSQNWVEIMNSIHVKHGFKKKQHKLHYCSHSFKAVLSCKAFFVCIFFPLLTTDERANHTIIWTRILKTIHCSKKINTIKISKKTINKLNLSNLGLKIPEILLGFCLIYFVLL